MRDRNALSIKHVSVNLGLLISTKYTHTHCIYW